MKQFTKIRKENCFSHNIPPRTGETKRQRIKDNLSIGATQSKKKIKRERQDRHMDRYTYIYTYEYIYIVASNSTMP